jgi:hypothetical protein
MKRYISIIMCMALAFGVGCSTFERLDRDEFFDDVLSSLATAGATWVMNTFLLKQDAASDPAEEAIAFLITQRARGFYSPTLLQSEAQAFPYNPVLDRVLKDFRDYVDARGINVRQIHINSLIKGIQEARDR